MRFRRSLLLLVFATFFAGLGNAAPFVPAGDAQILETLRDKPLEPATRELRAMRAGLRANPQNLELALSVARRYIEQSRAEADPRYLGYAQAALAPWWTMPTPPAPVLVLRATIQQSNHNFDAALADLEQALKLQPNNPQAWLTRATVLKVRGEYGEARKSCEQLARAANALIVTACFTNIASMNGDAERAYRQLGAMLDRSPNLSAGEKIWILTALAEMAERLGNNEAAEQRFKNALSLAAPDSYLKGAYADFLLDRGRAAEVIDLLKNDMRADALLLRLALAEKALVSTTLNEHVAILRARFDASRLRGDTVHRREEARFTLHLLNDPETALKLAQANWQVQREPADVRILLETALGASDRQAARPVIDWLARTRLEDRAVAELSDRLKSGIASENRSLQ